MKMAAVWENRAGGAIRLVLQLSIGIIDLTDDSKESFAADGGTISGVPSLPSVPFAGWTRHAVHRGGVAPTRAAPQQYTRDWYTQPLRKPLYTLPGRDIMFNVSNIPAGVVVEDLVIDVGRIFYAAFKTG